MGLFAKGTSKAWSLIVSLDAEVLGFLEILYTPSAMISAQAVIATPIVTGRSLQFRTSPPPGLYPALPGKPPTQFS